MRLWIRGLVAAARGPNTVAVIDLANLAVKSEIAVGREPDGMAWARR